MDPKRWQGIQEIFEKSLTLIGVERDTYLAEACKGDQDLQQEILELLDNVAPASDFFDGLEREIHHAFQNPDSSQELIGSRVGPYEISRSIGKGGMGEVFLAQRAEGDFEQEVAIKFVKQDPWSRGLGEKFNQERQILSRLKHPNIARIYDGGSTKEGSSYLVMEYVEGKDILTFAQEHQLSPRERLKLFLKIAKATSFAHQNLILHRDIKPSNILMGADQEPRLLDFGIAKLMDDSPLETQTQVFTPEYASPEQVAGAPLNTSSDIYQLGLLLYELITGRRAHSLRGKGLLERQKIILEEIPALPSSQIAGSPDARFVKGDLDEVIMACLRKEASKRYQDVGDLIQDLEAILENEPISLKAQDWQYRSSKFIQRNQLGIGLVSLAMLFLLGGIFFTARENLKAQKAILQQKEALERESAVTNFLKSLFLARDPYGLLTKTQEDSLGKIGSVEATVDRMVPLFLSRFEENPSLQKTAAVHLSRLLP